MSRNVTSALQEGQPPEGTRSCVYRGTRYDLCPHANGEEVLLVEWRAEEPSRVESSWISVEPGLAGFERNFGRHAEPLPTGSPLPAAVAAVVAKRLYEERELPSEILAGLMR